MEIATLYTDFRRTLFSYIKGKISSKEDAEDILQNVFLKIAADSHALDNKQSIKNWVFIVTRNAIIDYYRMKAKSAQLQPDLLSLDTTPEEEEQRAIEELACCLHNMIDQLPEDYRQVVIESELNGLKQKDLAEKYGMAYSSLRSRVQRGRERLKQIILECCKVESDTRGGILEVTPRKCGDGC
ncbi:MAG: RNA polymerase sigma factor SigZ [Imperialibacter sp.]|uniref:RNA polymerase sigma factor SigZ n=1 Tax=Imperialibacter sp. TaxID=2038411 RepID=UPI0032EF1012